MYPQVAWTLLCSWGCGSYLELPVFLPAPPHAEITGMSHHGPMYVVLGIQ